MLSVEKEVAQVLPACGKEVGTGAPWGESTGRVCHMETRQVWALPVGNKWVIPLEKKLEGEEVSAFASSA